jgi:hypothetical protein
MKWTILTLARPTTGSRTCRRYQNIIKQRPMSDNPDVFGKGLGTRRANRCRKTPHTPHRHRDSLRDIALERWLPPGCQKAQSGLTWVTNCEVGTGIEALSGETWYNVVAQGCGGRDYSRFEVSNLGRIRTASANETLDRQLTVT